MPSTPQSRRAPAQMLPLRLRARVPRILLPACCLALPLAACGEGPLAPTSYAQQVQGRMWVAVAEPEGLADARTWLPSVPPGSPVQAQVKEQLAEAGRARRAGRLEEAAELEAAAARAAAAAVQGDTGPLPVLRSLDALERWDGRAQERLAQGSYPELERAVAEVEGLRRAARASLDRGDTTAAAVQLTQAAERARREAPQAVALRLIAGAEARINAEPNPSESLRRARRLLRGAREGMATGDHPRALRRAVYALQLLDGRAARAR